MKQPGKEIAEPIDYDKIQQIAVDPKMIPGFNTARAIAKGVGNKFMLVTWGGLGDQICSIPSIAWALANAKRKAFEGVEISIASEALDLFGHLEGFKDKFDLNRERPLYEKFMVFRTIEPPSHMLWQFASHCLTNAVDFCTICMFRATLPIEDKNITLPDYPLDGSKKWHSDVQALAEIGELYLWHPGKHWPSKTAPKKWCDELSLTWRKSGIRPPFIIGKDTDDNRSTVDVNTEGLVDLRNQTTLKELIWLCKNANLIFTNDSSPLHMGAAGKAHIVFYATCKHPDYIMHWRQNQEGWNEWAWRMTNISKDGSWNHTSYSPVQTDDVSVEFLPKSLTWDMILPTAQETMTIIKSKLDGK